MGKAGRFLLLVVAVLIGIGYLVDASGGAAATPPAAAPAPATYVKPVVHGTVTSEFGSRWGEFHGGLDIGADIGEPIRAVTAGTMIVARPATGFGLWMQVRHPDGTVTVYGHMDTMDRAVGAHVKTGEQIATVGARGEATGPHLHIEVWPHGDRGQRVNPRTWLAKHGVRY